MAAAICCASRTPTGSARPRRRSTRSSTGWAGSGSTPTSRRCSSSSAQARHAEVALRLLAEGKAYRCYATPEELDAMRARQRAQGLPMRYDGRWRDRDPREAPPGVPPVVRLKAPQTGETDLEDLVQGEIEVANEQLDDMVLLRGDGTPTYMLSVVVDDIDMGDHPCHPGPRPSDQHLPPDPALPCDRRRAAPLRPHPADPWPGRRQAQQAARRLERDRVPRDGLPARGGAQLSAAAGLGPRRRGDHRDRAGDRVVRPRRGRPLAGPLRPRQARRASTRTICASGPTRSWSSCCAPHLAAARPGAGRRRPCTARKPGWPG